MEKMQVDAPHIVRALSRSARRPKVAAAPRTRSMVTNQSKLLHGVDGRSTTARRFRDLIADYAREAGGSAVLSPAELGMVRQAAAMTLRAEQLQAAIVRGEPVLADEMIRLSSEARRVLAGLRKRHPRKAPPTLAEYLAARGGNLPP
jgi:hypothetical protein